MPQQTSTADMLDLAVEHIKGLQSEQQVIYYIRVHVSLQETGSLPTAIFFANCFFSTLGKEVPLPTGISCSRQSRICRLPDFADCQAVGKAMDLPTARQLAKNCSRQRQAMVDAIHTVTFADCHSVSSRQRRRLCQLPSSLAVGKEFLFFLIFDPSFLCCLDTVST